MLKRIEKLVTQILENRLQIISVPTLKQGLERAGVPYDPSLSPWCWLHNLLRKRHQRIDDLSDYGVAVLPAYRQLDLADLCEQIEAELETLTEAHYQRYYEITRLSGTA